MKQKPVPHALQPFLDGKMILINKPLHWTSFDAVKKVRICTKVSKVGHAGTLDPLATGLLIICTGKFTKRINEYMGMPKEYTGTFTLGARTPTYDLESEPIHHLPFAHITREHIDETVKKFTGPLQQFPPAHSAVKKDGKKLYELARKGEEVKTEPRPVIIYEFEITGVALPEVSFRVVCSTGTYIRSLAHDFGAALHTGAYLSKLCRTKIGNFSVEEAMLPADFEKEVNELLSTSEGQTNT